jgi:hypothetical protein
MGLKRARRVSVGLLALNELYLTNLAKLLSGQLQGEYRASLENYSVIGFSLTCLTEYSLIIPLYFQPVPLQ